MGVDDVVLDDRVFAIESFGRPGVVEGLGVLDEFDSNVLVGVYFSWSLFKGSVDFVYEISSYFGEVSFSTLGRRYAPGLVCQMRFQDPRFVGVCESSRNYRSDRLGLLEIRASRPVPVLGLYYDSARLHWAYKALADVSLSDVQVKK